MRAAITKMMRRQSSPLNTKSSHLTPPINLASYPEFSSIVKADLPLEPSAKDSSKTGWSLLRQIIARPSFLPMFLTHKTSAESAVIRTSFVSLANAYLVAAPAGVILNSFASTIRNTVMFIATDTSPEFDTYLKSIGFEKGLEDEKVQKLREDLKATLEGFWKWTNVGLLCSFNIERSLKTLGIAPQDSENMLASMTITGLALSYLFHLKEGKYLDSDVWRRTTLSAYLLLDTVNKGAIVSSLYCAPLTLINSASAYWANQRAVAKDKLVKIEADWHEKGDGEGSEKEKWQQQLAKAEQKMKWWANKETELIFASIFIVGACAFAFSKGFKAVREEVMSEKLPTTPEEAASLFKNLAEVVNEYLIDPKKLSGIDIGNIFRGARDGLDSFAIVPAVFDGYSNHEVKPRNHRDEFVDVVAEISKNMAKLKELVSSEPEFKEVTGLLDSLDRDIKALAKTIKVEHQPDSKPATDPVLIKKMTAVLLGGESVRAI